MKLSPPHCTTLVRFGARKATTDSCFSLNKYCVSHSMYSSEGSEALCGPDTSITVDIHVHVRCCSVYTMCMIVYTLGGQNVLIWRSVPIRGFHGSITLTCTVFWIKESRKFTNSVVFPLTESVYVCEFYVTKASMVTLQLSMYVSVVPYRIVARPASFTKTVDCPSTRCSLTLRWRCARRGMSKDSTRKQGLERLKVQNLMYMHYIHVYNSND